jgi:hypothetical protein
MPMFFSSFFIFVICDLFKLSLSTLGPATSFLVCAFCSDSLLPFLVLDFLKYGFVGIVFYVGPAAVCCVPLSASPTGCPNAWCCFCFGESSPSSPFFLSLPSLKKVK